MPKTARQNWPFPSEDQTPWYEAFKAFVTAVDSSFFTTREDKNFVLFGGGTVTFDAATGILTWAAPFEAVAASTGLHWYVPAPLTNGTVTLQDGEMFFVELTRAPQSAQSLAALAGSRINPNDDSLVLAVRVGDVVIFRNGAVVADGQSIVIGGPRVLTQVVEIVGIAGLQSTDQVSYVGKGGFRFDPTDYYPGDAAITRTIKFQAMLETTDDVTPFPAKLQLKNLTDALVVTASVLTSSSATPEMVEATLTISAEMPNGPRDYEVQLLLDDTLGTPLGSDLVLCKHAAIRITWS